MEQALPHSADNAKDLIIAVMGASVRLAGLLLVFGGFMFAQASGFPPDTTDDAIIKRFQNAGRFSALPFALCIAVAGIASWWPYSPEPWSFSVAFWGFLVALAGALIYGVAVLTRYL